MVWNYRLIKKIVEWNGVDYETYGIHEAFYEDGETIPSSWTKDAIALGCFETPCELRESFELMQKAFSKPVLEIVTLENGEQKLVTVPSTGEKSE